MQEAVPDPSVVEYPTSDGKPIAETDLHFDRMTYAAHALKVRYADTPDVYVGANMLVYDEPNNPRRHLAPDVFVVFGVPNRRRDLLKIWQEKPPSFVLEVTSKSTRNEDMRTKRKRYAAWGVDEYFLYDPRAEYLSPPLQGFALREGAYVPMAMTRFPNGRRGYASVMLGIHLSLRGSELRLFDPATGRDLRTYEESERAVEEAEAEVTELRARIRDLTGR
jgi:Uma2 family endonuclease